jgi:hypothetical protein
MRDQPHMLRPGTSPPGRPPAQEQQGYAMSRIALWRRAVSGIILGGQLRARCHERPSGRIRSQLMITRTIAVA